MILDRARSLGNPCLPLPGLYCPASSRELEAVLQDATVSVGSHTWSHVNLTTIPASEAEVELERSYSWVKDRISVGPIMVSYPYGAFAKRLEVRLRESGYEFGLLIRGGAAPSADLPSGSFKIPRLNVPRGISAEGFRARLAGIWPA